MFPNRLIFVGGLAFLTCHFSAPRGPLERAFRIVLAAIKIWPVAPTQDGAFSSAKTLTAPAYPPDTLPSPPETSGLGTGPDIDERESPQPIRLRLQGSGLALFHPESDTGWKSRNERLAAWIRIDSLTLIP